MGEVATVDLAARPQYIRLVFALSSEKFCFLFAFLALKSHAWKAPLPPPDRRMQEPLY
jgi:hypothetical protein